jgi:DNA-binding NtrC family response regulator
LLDELGELSLDVQAMLLRVIENREVLALGETRPAAIDVRFVATTQESLSSAVARGRFRPDLRARLEGTAIRLPALRDFRELVPELFSALFEKHGAARPEIVARDAERLCIHAWPLNFRELDTMVRHLAISYRPGAALELGALGSEESPSNEASVPSSNASAPPKNTDRSVPGRVTTAPYRPEELALLIETLARHGGNITRAASELGITRQKAYRMLEAAQGESTDGARERNGST